MAKVLLEVQHPSMNEFSVHLSRVPAQDEKVMVESRAYKVIDVIFTPNTNQDAVLVVRLMNAAAESPIK